MHEIILPEKVDMILERLWKSGFEAYIVGGCVRDFLMEKAPVDWDITTKALPEETKKCFFDVKSFDTGLKHGTITLHLDGENYEITTFRIDGEYSDNRRPDSVEFSLRLEDDLARRDFTVNAIAYAPQRGFVDCFGGMEDIKNGIISCVGDPDQRFKEDGLRIMRGLRLASVLGFSIEDKTAESILTNRELLKNIAAERTNVELKKLLLGENCGEVLRRFRWVIAVFIPEIVNMFDFQQHNHHHIFDVWNHTVKAVESCKKDVIVRLALLLHDIGKPYTFTLGGNGIGHFYGHQKVSEDIASVVLKRLKFDSATIQTVLTLIKYHDYPLNVTTVVAKRLLNKIGEENVRYLLDVKRGDLLGHNPLHTASGFAEIDGMQLLVNEIIENQSCFSVQDLAVKGEDLLELGIPQGAKIGEILTLLTEMVIEEKIDNKKEDLIAYIKKELTNF